MGWLGAIRISQLTKSNWISVVYTKKKFLIIEYQIKSEKLMNAENYLPDKKKKIMIESDILSIRYQNFIGRYYHISAVMW